MPKPTPAVQSHDVQLSFASRLRVGRAAHFTPSVANGNLKQWGLAILWWGQSGVAKTAGYRLLMDLCRARYFVFSPGEQGEGGIGAVPVPALDGYIDYPLPRWAEPFMAADGYGGVLIDEALTADTRMQPAMMALALERTIGGKSLGRRVRVNAASNPIDLTPGGTELAPPLANRFIHLDWPIPSVDEVLDYLTSTLAETAPSPEGFSPVDDPLAEEARVLAAWPSAFAEAIGAIGGFLHAAPARLHNMPEAGSTQQGKAWPSPRSWDMAARSFAGASIHCLTSDERLALIAGCVGPSLAREFITYSHNLDLPKTADLLLGKAKWDVTRERLDRTYAVLRGLNAHVTGIRKDHPQFEPMVVGYWQLLRSIAAVRPDMTLPRLQESLKLGLHAVKEYPAIFKAAAYAIELVGQAKVAA